LLLALVMRNFAMIGLLAAAACSGGGDDVIGDDGGGTCELAPMGNGMSTLTGCADAGFVDGDRGDSLFANPVNVAVGPDGRVYVADFDNNKIRVVEQDGSTTTLTAQDGFARPFGLAFDGNTLFVQTDNNPQNAHSLTTGTLWRVNISTGDASVIAQDLGKPRGIAVLGDGRIVMSDYQHHVVKLLDPGSGAATTLAGTLDSPGFADGTGTAAKFNQPYDVAVLGDGTIAVADFGNNRIRQVTLAGVVTTMAGSGQAGNADGSAGSATFHSPQGLALDGDALYVTDIDNFVVRRVLAGSVDTVAGNGSGTYVDADDARAAGIFGLEGIDVGSDGVLYVADGNRGEAQPHNRIRRLVVD
jgi:sugar lactone lactonase YvrE